MIRLIKASWQIPVVVLTNGTLLYREDVRTDLMQADIVIPSLDAASPEAFSRVNRPHPKLELGRVLAGLRTFSTLFQGRLWLEVMLVKGVNDTLAELERIREATQSIRHDKIQINTVIRPPAFYGVEPVGRAVLEQAISMFGSTAEIISDPHVRGISRTNADLRSAILQIIRRRPLSTPQISRLLGTSVEAASLILEKLLSAKRIKAVVHDGETFYTMTEPHD
jgi:wyosine [tRNA(Phe)-imidazoG37] synthetase (radical SAM superfamily)